MSRARTLANLLSTLDISGDVTLDSLTANTVISTGPVTAPVVTANTVYGTVLTGTLSTAPQPNITSVGTLSTLSSGQITGTAGAGFAGPVTAPVVTANTVIGTLLSISGNANVQSEFIATSYNESFVNITQANTINCEQGNFFYSNPNNNIVYNFTNPPTTGTGYGFGLKITANATITIGWPASVDWAGGTAPDAPASGETDLYTFVTHDGGTTWYGAIAIDAAG